MRLLRDVLWIMQVTYGGRTRYQRGRSGHRARPGIEHRELAKVMRVLPGQYADRLSDRTHNKIKAAAAAGQWEHAIRTLITMLRRHAKPVTAQERDQLRALLDAMNMPRDLLGHLRPAPLAAPGTSSPPTA